VALAERGVRLAHFHFGGTYGWGIRVPGRSPFPFLARAGIVCCTTIHSVVSILAGYCGPRKPLWFKLALFPAGWLGKLSALRHIRTEIAVSAHDARLLRRWYWPFAGRVRQIYHSRLAEADFRPPEAPRRKVILNVGHLAERKGQHLLVEAFARVASRHPAWTLEIVGPPLELAYTERLARLAADAGLAERVAFPGSCDGVLAVMVCSAIYAQPSLEEALGLALQEALACGCACIGARTGGIPELITDGDNGLLYPAHDVAALAGALDRLMTDESQRAIFSARGPQSLRERGMTAAQMVERHAALYDEILSSR
jgi:glycosyltransferase involved in cell wall biosynthesis